MDNFQTQVLLPDLVIVELYLTVACCKKNHQTSRRVSPAGLSYPEWSLEKLKTITATATIKGFCPE